MKSDIPTANEGKVLAAIKTHIALEEYPPSIREIMRYCDISSTSVVDYCLTRLCQKGYIKRKEKITRSIVLLEKAKAKKVDNRT